MDNDFKTTLLNDIYEAAIYKLAAAPRSFASGARAAKPPSAGQLGTKANFVGQKPSMVQPTGKPALADSIKRPMTSTGNMNDQLVLNTGMQSAGFRYPITQTAMSSGGTPIMNTSQG